MTISANYSAEADKRNIQINYLIEIDGVSTTFSKQTVSGLVGAQEATISKMKWNPPKLSIDNTKVSIGTIDVTLIDPNGTIMAALAAGSLHLKELTLKRGFTNLDIADYNTVAVFRIAEYSSTDGVSVHMKGRDRLTELLEPVLFNKTILSSDMTDVATSAAVDDTTGFPSSGTIFIDSEKITYSGKTATSFTGLTRGAEPADHDEGADAHEFVSIQENPVDIMLQMLISPGGGGTYDVLSYGLGIPQADVNITTFEDVRDNSNLTGNAWKFEFTDDISNLMTFFQTEVFQFSNTRLFVDEDGKISCALFQEVTLDQYAGAIGEEDIQPLPKVVSNSDRVINRIRVKYDLDPETGKYLRETTYNDTETDSQTDFGIREHRTVFASRGIRAGLDGTNLAQNFAQKYFRRVSQPTGRIKQLKALWKRQFYKAGDKVRLTHSKVYDLVNGAAGITDRLVEVNSVKYDMDTGRVTYEINNSPFLNTRFGFISPASTIASGASTTVFTLTTGEAARAEWADPQVVELYLLEDGSKVSGPSTISDVSGEVVTVLTPFSTTPTNAHGIRFGDYDEITSDQKLFASVTDDDNNFPSDSGESYKVS